MGEKPGSPATLPGILRIVAGSHIEVKPSGKGGSRSRDHDEEPRPASEVDPLGRPIPEVRPEELTGADWLPAVFWHHPDDAPFPGQYAVVIQPFIAGAEETGHRDANGGPLTYLVLFVSGLVAPGASLEPELVRTAFHDAVARATQLAKGLSQEMQNASVRLLLARMPEWMGRKLLPGLRDVRKV